MGKNFYPDPARWVWMAFFVVITSALLAGGYGYYRSEFRRIQKEKYEDLAAIAELKADQIREWRQERLEDIGSLSRSPMFKRTFEEWLRDRKNELLLEDLKDKLVVEQRTGGYADAILLSPDGNILLSVKPQPDPLSPATKVAIGAALANRSPVLSDLYRNPQGTVLIDAVAPILGPKGQPIAAGLFRSNAESLLYPLIQSWPTSSRTAETLLIRKDGDGVLFLNDLRHRANTALSLRDPLTLTELPAVQAVLGKQGMFHGKDYRGVEVLADLRPVPDSPWFMVAKVDSSEILSEARNRGEVTALFAGLFILLAAGVTAYGYRYRQARLYQDLYRSEREQRQAQEQFRTTLYSIGDAVITTDTGGLMKQMNPVAELLTGWLEAEAKGKPLDEVFHIVNEDSREELESPVQGVLREGQVVGLANHNLLISKDGVERPIADSGAPIRDETSAITGVVLVFRDQTEERRSRKALEESEERYRTLADHIYDWEFWIAPDGRLVYCSPSCERVTGYRAEEYVSDPDLLNRIVHPDDAAIWDQHGSRTSQCFDTCEFDYRIIPRNGEVVWIAHCCSPVYTGEGRYLGRRISHRDITKRKRAEAALVESEKKFRLLYEEAPVAYQSLDEEGHLLQVNQTWLQLLRYTPDEVIGRIFADFLTPRSQERFRETFAEFKRFGQVHGVELEIVCKDKSVIDVSIDGRISRAGGGEFRHTHCVFQDITQRKKSEKALQESEQKYRATFNTASVGIDLVDRQGRFVEVNNTTSEFLGYTAEEIRHLTIFDVTHPEDVSRSREMHEAMIRGEMEAYRLEKRYMRKDGSILWANVDVSAIRDADGQYRATVGVIRDITQRKKLEETHIRLAAAVEQAAETVEITDPEGTIVYVNPSFETTTGYSREEVVGNNPRILKSGHHDVEFYKRMWDTIANGKIWTGHFINKKKDGTLFEEDVSISPVKDDLGKTVNYVAVKRDVTSEVSLQRQLLQAQKMEAIGTLAGGIAHDFNNILQVVLGYSELLLTGKSGKDPDHADLQKINHAACSGADLVRNLLTFSRKVEPKPVPMDLNNQIRNVEKLLHRTIPRMIDIRLELAEDLKRINADPGQIEQIIMNFAVNARDAMGEKGSLTIRTEDVVLDEEYCRMNAEARPGDHVMLSVSDTGHGMDRETLQHIFEPFYTTKELGRGTGLGLAMVYGIVKQHDGHLTCYSEVGKGTTFRVYLPAILSEPEDVAESVVETPAFGTETLLLVDDEEFVRDLGARILSRVGYKVLTATNGKEALDLFQREHTQISLVILDLIMPEMGGKECLRELRKIDPNVKVLIASGLSADSSLTESSGLGARGFVSKPFKMKELLRQVRKVLDQS